MVGIPGRSSGCITCRKRHIKCDERKPACRRCEKSGYTCQGYKKPIHFLIHTVGGVASSSTPEHPAPKTQPSKSSAQQVVTRRKQQQWAYYFPAMPPEIGLDGFVDDMSFSFTFSNLVYSSFGRPWLQLAAQGSIDDMSLAACKALALGFFGNSQRQRKIQDRGASEYGTSLRLLIQELSKVDQVNAGRYIIPVMVLLMYNFSVSKNSDFSHHDGLLQLVLLCGPERFQQQPWLSAFEATRDLLISKALLERKRTFFEEDRWKTIPWALNPAAKSPTNHLHDILVDVPGFLEDETIIKRTNDTALQLSLLSRVEQRLQDLYQWRWAWEAHNQGTVFEIPARPTPDIPSSEIPRDLEKMLRYRSFLQANELCLYNAVLLWLLRFLGELRPSPVHSPLRRSSSSPTSASSPRFPSSSPAEEYAYLQRNVFANMRPTPLLLPGQARTLRQPAIEICRSFEYLLDSFCKTNDTALSWLMPISLAYYVVQEDHMCASWIRKKLDGFEDIWSVLQNTNPGSVYWYERRSDRYEAFPSQFGTAFIDEFRPKRSDERPGLSVRVKEADAEVEAVDAEEEEEEEDDSEEEEEE